MLHFIFLLTDSWGNLTAFSISCSIAATFFPALRAANFSPATLRKFLFWEVDDMRVPHPPNPSIPALISWQSCFQFCAVSMGWESGFVVSGQSLAEHGLRTQPFPLLWLYWEVPNQHCTEKLSLSFQVFLQHPPRNTTEPVPWLTLTWKRNIHSGCPSRTHGTLTQQREF